MVLQKDVNIRWTVKVREEEILGRISEGSSLWKMLKRRIIW